MGKGKRFEMAIVNEITERSDGDVWATRPDFSGNSKHAVADVCIVWPRRSDSTIHGAFVELKKRSVESEGKRASDALAGSANDQNGIEELEALIEGTPPWANAYVAVKFQHRELMVYDAETLYDKLQDGTSRAVGSPRLTRSGNVSIAKPTLDEWESTASGKDDAAKLLTATGVDARYWQESAYEIEVDV